MKQHRAWVEVDSKQLYNNIKTIQAMLPEGTAFALVIKANAYGHDINLISKYCEQQHLVDFFCVAHLTEALALRRNGTLLPIIVLSTLDASLEDAIMQDIDLSVSNLDQLLAIHTAAQKLQKKAHIHIKVDTGLARFGFLPNQIPLLISQVITMQHIIVCGLFSHFAQSDNTDQTYTKMQRDTFKNILNRFLRSGIRPQYIHQQNSAAIITQPDLIYNMVRIGALAYGIWSSDFQKKMFERATKKSTIKQVLNFKSSIIEIKAIPPGMPIGYNGLFVSKHVTVTAKVPVGYADGYSRYFGITKQPTYVLIKNQYAPIIGHIGMNVLMVDITHIHSIKVGDEVLLTGSHNKVTANALCSGIGSGNPREVTTHISPTLIRILT